MNCLKSISLSEVLDSGDTLLYGKKKSADIFGLSLTFIERFAFAFFHVSSIHSSLLLCEVDIPTRIV